MVRKGPLEVDADRLWRNLRELAQIGATRDGGVSRPSFSSADIEARNWFVDRVRQAGLTASVDAAGNIFGRYGGEGPSILVGSHIDSVPGGGSFDGAVGVLGGLECLQRLRDLGISLAHPVEVVAFTDEEGRFLDFIGSMAFVQPLDPQILAETPDLDGIRLVSAMASAGLDLAQIRAAHRQHDLTLAYLELHIEQGPILESIGKPIGLVHTIRGISRLRVTFYGMSGHSGTTPMRMRRDAFAAAAEFAARGRTLALELGQQDITFTIGVVEVCPNLPTIIPAECRLIVDIRHLSRQPMADIVRVLRELAGRVASEYRVKSEVLPIFELPPTPLDKRMQEVISRACESIGIMPHAMASGAGHDAMILAPYIPTGMIFIPSHAGCSHVPAEFTERQFVEHGANVLLNAIVALAGG